MKVFGKWIIAITIGIGSFTIPSGEARAEEPEIELELPDIDPARIPKPKMPRILKGQLMTSAGTSSLGGVGFFELVAGGDTRLLLAPSVGYFIADDVEVALAAGMNARFGDDGGVSFSMRGALHWYVDWQGQMFRLGTHVGLGEAYAGTGALRAPEDGMLVGAGVMWVVPLTRYFAALIGVELNIGLDFSEKGDSTLSMPMGLTGFAVHFLAVTNLLRSLTPLRLW